MGATPQDDLREEVAARRVVIIVGAGVSVAASGGAPTASWTGLLADGVAFCQSLLGPSLPAGWADRRRVVRFGFQRHQVAPNGPSSPAVKAVLDRFRPSLTRPAGPK
jgi:hypothetical protein